MPTAAHFLYIPGILILGIVLGWILGSRAAADVYAAQLRKTSPRREETSSGRSASPFVRFRLQATECLRDRQSLGYDALCPVPLRPRGL